MQWIWRLKWQRDPRKRAKSGLSAQLSALTQQIAAYQTHRIYENVT
jgi:hypothetical protein